MGVTFDGRGFQRALKKLQAGMNPGGPDRNRILKRAAAVDVKQNAETFSKERDPRTGRPWMSLEEENKHYAKWKRRNWPGRKLLVWTGTAMRNPATRNSDGARIARWKGRTIQLGVESELGVKHQQGESYSRPKMIFLRERKRYFPGGRKFVYRNGKRTKQQIKGRAWFTLWLKRLPARPFIGKSEGQAAELRSVVAAELIRGFQRVLGGDRLRVRGSRLARTAAAGRLVRRG